MPVLVTSQTRSVASMAGNPTGIQFIDRCLRDAHRNVSGEYVLTIVSSRVRPSSALVRVQKVQHPAVERVQWSKEGF